MNLARNSNNCNTLNIPQLCWLYTSTTRMYPSFSPVPLGTKIGSPMNLRLTVDHMLPDLSDKSSFTTESNGKCGSAGREPEVVPPYMYLFFLPEKSGFITGKSVGRVQLLRDSTEHFWQSPSASMSMDTCIIQALK